MIYLFFCFYYIFVGVFYKDVKVIVNLKNEIKIILLIWFKDNCFEYCNYKFV